MFAIVFLSPTLLALTKGDALNRSKVRIDGLKSRFAQLATNCYQFDEDCNIVGNSQLAVLKWYAYEVSESTPIIQYSSGSANFLIDGAVRVAKTGRSWGAPVIFNEDLLTIEIEDGNFRALTFFEILGILIHEFGHHQEEMLIEVGLPILTHEQLDELAVRTVSYLRDRTKVINIGADEVPGLLDENGLDILYIEIESFNGIRNIWSNIFIDSRDKLTEISESLVVGLVCPKSYYDGRLTFLGSPRYFSIRKTHAPTFAFEGINLQYNQRFDDGSVLCIDRKFNRYEVFSGYTKGILSFGFSKNKKNQLIFVNGSLSATAPPDQNSN